MVLRKDPMLSVKMGMLPLLSKIRRSFFRFIQIGTVLVVVSVTLYCNEIWSGVQQKNQIFSRGQLSNIRDSDSLGYNVDSGVERIGKNAVDLQAYEYLLRRYPWLTRSNTIGNTYTISHDVPRNTSIVFLHHHKAGGTTIKECMNRVNRGVSDRDVMLMSFGNIGMPKSMMYSQDNRMYAGGTALGVCDHVDTNCSYFTVLREPYDRILSQYRYCIKRYARLSRNENTKHVLNVTFNEWVKMKGSALFNQLFANEELCNAPKYGSVGFDAYIDEKYPMIKHEAGIHLDHRQLQCWKIQRLFLEYHLNTTEKKHLLQYFLDNLDNWFTVIGFIEEIEVTLELLQEVYHLPFRDMCVHQNKCFRRNENSAESDITVYNSLVYDHEVEDALYYDIKLYKKAQHIFANQLLLYNITRY